MDKILTIVDAEAQTGPIFDGTSVLYLCFRGNTAATPFTFPAVADGS